MSLLVSVDVAGFPLAGECQSAQAASTDRNLGREIKVLLRCAGVRRAAFSAMEYRTPAEPFFQWSLDRRKSKNAWVLWRDGDGWEGRDRSGTGAVQRCC